MPKNPYCHITNGEIDVGPRALPNVHGNTSGLRRLSDEALRDFGWFPYRQDIPGHDPDTHVVEADGRSITGTEVVDNYTVRAKTQAELDTEARNVALEALRNSDAGMARIAEDIIAVLKDQGVIDIEPLMEAEARQKLAERRAWRATLQG